MTDDIILSSISDLEGIDRVLSDDMFLVTTKNESGMYVSNKVDFLTLSSSLGLKSAAFRRDTEFATQGHLHNGTYSPLRHNHDEDYSDIDHDHDLSYSPIDHDHEGVYAEVGHTHSGYLTSVPVADDDVIGGFKTGFKDTETKHGVKIENDYAYVEFNGGQGSSVKVNPIVTSGTKIAEITVDGDKKDLYSPSGSGSTMATPVGTIIAWTGLSSDEKIPKGYLICNGQEVSKTEYSDLYNVVGDKFGEASSGKFKLPLLTDQRYLQGNKIAGTSVDEELPNITGTFPGEKTSITAYWDEVTGSFYCEKITNDRSGKSGRDSDNTNISFSASKSSAIYKDNGHVIPKSMTVIYLICYKVIGTYIGGGYGGGVDFYPCKSVPQPDCASYVIETGKFSSVDGTKHTTASENDSWYRLYSDGWCEQGGSYKLTGITSETTYDVILNKKFDDNITCISQKKGNGIYMDYCVVFQEYSSNEKKLTFRTDYDSAKEGQNITGFCWDAKGWIK